MKCISFDDELLDVLEIALKAGQSPKEVFDAMEIAYAKYKNYEGCITSIITSRPEGDGPTPVTVRIRAREEGRTDYAGMGLSNGRGGSLTDDQVKELKRAQNGNHKVKFRLRFNEDGSRTVMKVEVLTDKCSESGNQNNGSTAEF